jgi:hypothetical protein
MPIRTEYGALLESPFIGELLNKEIPVKQTPIKEERSSVMDIFK